MLVAVDTLSVSFGFVSSPIEELRDAIAAAQTVVISGHKGPDGDCIGAALALMNGLRAIGKDVTVFSNDAVPQIVRFLPGADRVMHLAGTPEAAEASVAGKTWDLGILVDVGFTQRAGKAEPALLQAETLAVVDHHELGPDTAGDIRIIDPRASATCLILADIFEDLGLAIDKKVATCLLTGIVTDTGSFRFRNTDAASLAAASRLLGLGADLPRINEEVWDSRPLDAIRLLTTAFEKMEFLSNNRLAVTHLDLADYDGAMDEHTEGIASEVARIQGVLVAAVFREPKLGNVRVSVRSRGEIDIAEVCRMFGGGGHKNAAGCTFLSSVEDAMAQMVPALEACLESS